MVVDQYAVFLIETRPCLVLSPDEMNRTLGTVIIAPMTTKSHGYPSRVEIEFQGKQGWIVLDQIRTVDKTRLVKRMGRAEESRITLVKNVLREMLVD